MKEFVGNCTKCEKEIYCMEGFLNGAILKEGLFCFDCAEKKDEE